MDACVFRVAVDGVVRVSTMKKEDLVTVSDEFMTLPLTANPPALSCLELAPDSNVAFHMICPVPNWWHRFWMRVFFGWRWTSL